MSSSGKEIVFNNEEIQGPNLNSKFIGDILVLSSEFPLYWSYDRSSVTPYHNLELSPETLFVADSVVNINVY